MCGLVVVLESKKVLSMLLVNCRLMVMVFFILKLCVVLEVRVCILMMLFSSVSRLLILCIRLIRIGLLLVCVCYGVLV